MSSALTPTRLTRAQAKRLTQRIQSAAESLWHLLLEAHEGKAHLAMGYRTWKEYAAAEFGMTERSAFRVLDQGTVSRALTAAAKEPVEVSQRQAAAVKPHLDEAVRRVGEGEAPAEVVREIAQSPRQVDELPPADTIVSTPSVAEPTLVTETFPQDHQGPIPWEAGEGVTDAAPPQPVTPDPVQPQRAQSGGGGGVPRASAAALSAGSPALATPTAMVRALLAISKKEWATVDVRLVTQLATTVRRVAAGNEKPILAMKASDCRHPANRRIGDFCGACSRPVAGMKA